VVVSGRLYVEARASACVLYPLLPSSLPYLTIALFSPLTDALLCSWVTLVGWFFLL
jgi:hypothetical protein